MEAVEDDREKTCFFAYKDVVQMRLLRLYLHYQMQ